MLSTSTIIIIAVAAGVGLFFTLALPLVFFLRVQHRRLLNRGDLTEQFNSARRVRLSVGSTNYGNVPQPRTHLRRSTHLPYGVVSEGWAAVPIQETLAHDQTTLVDDRPGTAQAENHHKRRRSLRASFSIPKTRRQKKIARAIPLSTLPRSPLSAITEHSGTNTTEASPSVGIVELPTKITPKSTPEKDRDARPSDRSPSPQWPLTSTMRASFNDEPKIPLPASPNSTMMRMNTTSHSTSPVRPALSPRSVSMVSGISLAPDDPLPPLPSITSNQLAPGRRTKSRLSAASVDTIGSSVLGGRTSPFRTETELTSIGLATPPIDLNTTGLQACDRDSQSWEPSVMTTGSPKGRHATKHPHGKAGYGSFTASVRHHSSLQGPRNNHIANLSDRGTSTTQAHGSALTIDTSDWRYSSMSRAHSVKSAVSLSSAAALARNGSVCSKDTVATRHPMYEWYSGIGDLAADLAVLRDISGNQISPMRRRASSIPPSSVNESPFHWDINSLQTGLSSTLKISPGSQLKGHKRQNCVRISNLPSVDTSQRSSKLPQMTEEEEDSETSTNRKMVIPGLSLLDQKSGTDNLDAGCEPFDASPFISGPILKPTSCRRPEYYRAMSSESVMSYKRDSDVFSDARYDPNSPNIFSEKPTPQRQWPLSPTPMYRAKTQATPPSLRPNQQPYGPDSPTIPRPIISSATLFARAVPLGPRISGVQGPRNLPTSGRSSRTASPSPGTARAMKQEDLRRSVITLRRKNSNAKDKGSISQIYPNIGIESTSSLLGLTDRDGRERAESSSVSGIKVFHGKNNPDASTTDLLASNVTDQRVPIALSTEKALTVEGLRLSKSRNKIAPSPSVRSVSAVSIWDDASVRGDSPEPDVPALPRIPSFHRMDSEAYENFIVQDKRSQKDKGRESKLTSPQGKGLGLTGVQLDGKKWGTPGSLYDPEGFLKE